MKRFIRFIFQVLVFIIGTYSLHIGYSEEITNKGTRSYAKTDDPIGFWYNIVLFSLCLLVILYFILKDIIVFFIQNKNKKNE